MLIHTWKNKILLLNNKRLALYFIVALTVIEVSLITSRSSLFINIWCHSFQVGIVHSDFKKILFVLKLYVTAFIYKAGGII